MQGAIQFLQIEPTTRCNFTCGFCAGRHLPQQDMPLEHFRRLIDNLTQLTHVELQGEGEPLLHPDFFAMVAYLRQKFPAVKISLITNGSLFTETVIDQLLRASLTSILVSLESAEEAEFQAIRGGKFSRVKRGLHRLIQHKQAHDSATPRVGLAVTLLRSTWQNLNAIAQLYEELALDGGILLQPLQTMQVYRQFYDAQMQQNILLPQDHRQVDLLIARDTHLRDLLVEYQRQPGFYGELYEGACAEPTCPWLERGLFIGAAGVAASCCFIKDLTTDGLGPIQGPLGDITQARLQILAQLRQAQVPRQCQGCGTAEKMRYFYGSKQTLAATDTTVD